MNYHEQLEGILKLVDGEDAYQRLVALFLQGREEARDLIRAKWDFGFKWIYPNPQRLACRKNERYSCGERALATLVYDAIENLKNEDPRDKLVVWAIVFNSCFAAGNVSGENFRGGGLLFFLGKSPLDYCFLYLPPEKKKQSAFFFFS